MHQALLTLTDLMVGFFHDRKAAMEERDERGDTIAFLALAVLVIVVVVFMIPGVKDLASKVLAYIGSQLGV